MDTTTVIGPRTSVLPSLDTLRERGTFGIGPVAWPLQRPGTLGKGALTRQRRSLGLRGTIERIMGFSDSRQPATTAAAVTDTIVPADEVVWGFVVKEGFDELDDPWYHRGLTQHAYREGNDFQALCGFRPPLSGPRERRRPRLALPTAGVHPMCNACARRVGPPRHRVAVPVQPQRPPVAVPVRPVPVAAPAPARAVAGHPQPGRSRA
jgi:hypothetical protein